MQVLAWFRDGAWGSGGVGGGVGGVGGGGGGALPTNTGEAEATGKLSVCRIKNKFSYAQEDVVRQQSYPLILAEH